MKDIVPKKGVPARPYSLWICGGIEPWKLHEPASRADIRRSNAARVRQGKKPCRPEDFYGVPAQRATVEEVQELAWGMMGKLRSGVHFEVRKDDVEVVSRFRIGYRQSAEIIPI